MKKITVHITDGSEISRSGIVYLLNRSQKIGSVYAHSTVKKFFKVYREVPDAVCIISSNFTEYGLRDIMQTLSNINSNCRVIILSSSSDIAHVNQALNNGVKGYVTRQATSKELEKTVVAVWNGEKAFSRNVTKTIVGHYAKKRHAPAEPIRQSITKREREILSYIVQGLTSSEIAQRLYISPRTVETHRSNLMQKLDIRNTAGLVRYALEEGENL